MQAHQTRTDQCVLHTRTYERETQDGFEEFADRTTAEDFSNIMTNSGSCMISCTSADGVGDTYNTHQFTIKGGPIDAS